MNFFVVFLVLSSFRQIELEREYGKGCAVLNVGQKVKKIIKLMTERVSEEFAEKVIKNWLFKQELWRIGKNTDHSLFRMQIKPHNKHQINKRQGEHPRLIPERINIHDSKIHILTQPPKIVIGRLITVLELDNMQIFDNQVKLPQVHTVQVNVPVGSQAVYPAVESRCVDFVV
jgi:hypothetical protein